MRRGEREVRACGGGGRRRGIGRIGGKGLLSLETHREEKVV